MLINNLPIILIQYLLLTILIETMLAFFIGIRDKKDLSNVVLVNIVTNPLLNVLQVFIEYKYGIKMRSIAIFILEILAFLFEGFIYYKFLKNKRYNGFLLSFILNSVSYLICESINFLI